MQTRKSISGTESCKTVQDQGQESHLRDAETKWNEAATNCGMDNVVTVWNFTALQ